MLKEIFALMCLISFVSCQNSFTGSPQTVSAGELTNQYEKSNTNVRTMYNGKEIRVRGYAKNKAKLPAAGEHEGLIQLEEKGGASRRQVNCWFTKSDAGEFEQVKGEQYLTVRGVFNGEISTELKFCKLVKVE